jgi:hypothetical protein
MPQNLSRAKSRTFHGPRFGKRRRRHNARPRTGNVQNATVVGGPRQVGRPHRQAWCSPGFLLGTLVGTLSGMLWIFGFQTGRMTRSGFDRVFGAGLAGELIGNLRRSRLGLAPKPKAKKPIERQPTVFNVRMGSVSASSRRPPTGSWTALSILSPGASRLNCLAKRLRASRLPKVLNQTPGSRR